MFLFVVMLINGVHKVSQSLLSAEFWRCIVSGSDVNITVIVVCICAVIIVLIIVIGLICAYKLHLRYFQLAAFEVLSYCLHRGDHVLR